MRILLTRHAVSRRLCAGFLVLGAAVPALAQEPATIALDVADWVPGFDVESGGWTAVPTGTPLGKPPQLTTDFALNVAPGTYDIYWRQSATAPALQVAAGLVVGEGVTTVRVATGAAFYVANWVVREDDSAGWGVVPAQGYAGDPWLARTDGDAVFLPPGYYDFYWLPSDDATPIPVTRGDVPVAFGGIGVEIQSVANGLEVLTATETRPAAAAGVLDGDVIVTVDGVSVVGMTVTDAADLLRGTPGEPVVIEIIRSKGRDPLLFTIVRDEIQSIIVVRADSGIRIAAGSTLPALDPETGWWGAVEAGEPPTVMYNATADAGAPLLLTPGTYDLYWLISDRRDPFLVAEGVEVTTGTLSEIQINGRLGQSRR